MEISPLTPLLQQYPLNWSATPGAGTPRLCCLGQATQWFRGSIVTIW